MSKTDELIKKISDLNVELLGIINYLDENSIIYGVGQLEALQEDMQKLLESEISELKEQIKKEEKTAMELIREAFNPIQNARCSECNELIGTNAAHICQNKFEPKSIFTRRMERNARTYDFVVKHKILIYQNTRHYGNFTAGKNDCQLQELITLARKEIGYSDKTWSGDIFTSLVNLYRKICV